MADNYKASHGNDGALNGARYSPTHPTDRLRDHNGKEAAVSKREDNDHRSRPRPPKYPLKMLNGYDEVILKSDAPDNPLLERQDITDKKSDRSLWKEGSMLKPIRQSRSSQDKRVEQFEDGSSWGNKTHHEDEAPRFNTYYNSPIPPPYVKSNSKQKNGKFEANLDFSHEGGGGGISTSPSLHDKPDAAITTLDHDVANEVPALKSKSTRRKHSKSRSNHYDASSEYTKIVTRKPRSRRRDDTRRGLQLLFDDEQHRNYEEERIIDKLLLHYSKKPTIFVPEKSRRKSKSRHAHQMDNPGGESSRNETPEMNAVPPRSVSLPREEIEPVKVNKECTRAATFQPDRSSPARHVHPKLPDYDDLAARFAAMRGR